MYDVGESDAVSAAHSYLTNSSLFLVELMKEFGGIGICWEHRYVRIDSTFGPG